MLLKFVFGIDGGYFSSFNLLFFRMICGGKKRYFVFVMVVGNFVLSFLRSE